MKHKKKSLLFSIVALIVCCAMLAGTTLAWFTDSVQTTGNQINAGELKVGLQHKNRTVTTFTDVDADTDLFKDVAEWEPGALAMEAFQVKNLGNLALKFVLNFKPVADGSYNTANGGANSLLDVLYVQLLNTDPNTTRPGLSKNDGTPLQEFMSNNVNLMSGTVLPGGTSTEPAAVYVCVYWPDDLGNAVDNLLNLKNGAQSSDNSPMWINLNIELNATQAEHETDSFDNTYDAKADGTDSYSVGMASFSSAKKPMADTPTVFNMPIAPANENATTTVTFQNDELESDKTYTLDVETKDVVTSNNSFTISGDAGAVATITLTMEDELGNAVTSFSNPVTIKTKIAKGLMGIGAGSVVYNGTGTQPTFVSYDPATGELVFTTTHFSEYYVKANAVCYNAKTDTAYDTLQAAVAVGGEVTLLKDVVADRVSVTQNVTIDGNGKTLTDNTAGGRAIWIDADGVTLNLKNLTIDGANTCERGVQVNYVENGWIHATINMENCTLRNLTYYAINFAARTTVNLNVSNCSISGWAAINAYGTGNTIRVSNSTLEGINDKGYDAEGWNNFATVCLEGDTTGQTTLGSADYDVVIENSTIIAEQTTGNRQRAIGFNSNSKNSTVSLTNVTIQLGDDELCSLYYDNGTGNKLYVDSQLIVPIRNVWYYWDSDEGGYEGCNADLNDVFAGIDYILCNGEYIDLTDNVTLTKDRTATLHEGTGSFTLNLKGYTITGGKIIIPEGVSVITDTRNSGHLVAAVDCELTETVDGSTYTYTCVPTPPSVNTEEELRAALANGGVVTLNSNITLTSPLTISKDATLIGNSNTISANFIEGQYVSVASNANVTFKNVHFSKPTNVSNNASCLYAHAYTGTLVIDGCTFTDTQWDAIQITPMNDAKITITGCTFENPNVNSERYVHIEATEYTTNGDCKATITVTNNRFGTGDKVRNSIIDIDYVDYRNCLTVGGNTFADATVADGDIFVCGKYPGDVWNYADAYAAFIN